MSGELSLYQFKDHDLIELTDGRQPFGGLPEDKPGWKFRGKLPATAEAVSKFSAKSARTVLDQIERQGYCQLHKFDIAPEWRQRWTKEGRAQ